MSDKTKNPDDDTQSDAQPQRYQHDTATNVVPMQRDHLGRPYWESYLSPASYQVRAEARVPPHMPGVIIFVHGVNSEGEWYDFAEQALCEGLNDRLGRTASNSLSANEYSDIDKNKSKTIRYISKVGNSPVIRFYWGYSAEPGAERKWRIPMQNLRGANFWDPESSNEKRPWYWGGGPFQNGTNNLQQLWSNEGFKRHLYGVDLQELNTELDRQVDDAPPRRYFSHAAQRLADLIDRIRTKYPHDTVSVMSHSQGTMVALAATAMCKTRAPDALFVMNSPYALDDKITDALTCGLEYPTQGARVNTFRNIAHRIKSDRHVFTEAELKQLHCGASEDMNFWRPDNKRKSGVNERDNHGRLYVYFTPHDRVMGITTIQSIGWRGVDDKLLAELGDTVKQRMLARGTPVGDDPGKKPFGRLPPIQYPVPGVKPTEFWNGNRGAFMNTLKVWATPELDKMVTINAEKVPHPLKADEMTGFEESRVKAPEMRAMKRDPNTGKMTYEDNSYRFFRSLYEPQLAFVANPLSPIGVSAARETPNDMLTTRDRYHAEPTNHSTLPKSREFMRRVAAYDLPIGFCESYDDRDFWFGLINRADWTLGLDPYFETRKLNPVAKPALIDWETTATELSRLAVEKLKAAKFNPQPGWKKDVIYGD
ncbi:Alpha/beta hydrolase [Paraburkholderia sacchari]|uniref:T6SS effector phospholipase Tle3 domain-containing protein n=1 Tax=Paraburkholderia sacchari TaxID=159450 RepID=UPI0039A4D5F4